MNKIKLICILVAVLINYVTADKSNNLEAASTKFASELYQKVIENRKENVIFSPFSVQTALSMALLGATQETEMEMKTSMHYDGLTKENVAKNFNKIVEKFDNVAGLSLANKFYFKEGYSVKPTFNELATRNFKSSAESIDFVNSVAAAKTINDWVEEKTNQKIKDLINPDDLNQDTRMVIANAIYFNGAWESEFKPEETYKGKFYKNDEDTVEVDYMKNLNYFYYARLDDLSACIIALPYKVTSEKDFPNQVFFNIILPDSRTGLSDLENNLQAFDVKKMWSELYPEEIELEMPKFKIAFNTEMNVALEKLGMKKMFTDAAQFEELMDSPVKISKVFHKAFLDVNEKGTVAAGASSIMMVNDADFGPVSMKVHHPFLFLIATKDEILFMGRYAGT